MRRCCYPIGLSLAMVYRAAGFGLWDVKFSRNRKFRNAVSFQTNVRCPHTVVPPLVIRGVSLYAEPASSDSSSSSKGAGSARFTALEEVGDVTNIFDLVLSVLASDVGSIVLGAVGLLVCLVHRLVVMDAVMSADVMAGQETRSDLLAVFASGAVLLNGVSKLDVTSALAEMVQLEGVQLAEPQYCGDMATLPSRTRNELRWVMEAILSATPARTAVLVIDNDESWQVVASAGIIPNEPSPGQTEFSNMASTPILDRFRREGSKESYLPTLQALPGRFEFTYLPPNTQGALLLPARTNDEGTIARAVLVLGTDTAKSFTPRDVAWCQVLATRIGSYL